MHPSSRVDLPRLCSLHDVRLKIVSIGRDIHFIKNINAILNLVYFCVYSAMSPKRKLIVLVIDVLFHHVAVVFLISLM